MNLTRYAASVPRGVVEVACLELSHSAWPAVQRRAGQPQDVTVLVDGLPVLFPGFNSAGPWLSEHPGTDDSGRAERSVQLDDADRALEQLMDDTAESAEPVIARLRYYLSSDLTVPLTDPLIVETYEVREYEPDDDALTLTLRTRDLSTLADPGLRHTLENSPGLRGR